MGIEDTLLKQRLRAARDAEVEHVEAVLRVSGAKYLRLAHLNDRILQAYPDQDLELKANHGEMPALWLDFFHRVTMEPDSTTYRLDYVHSAGVDTLLQTSELAEILSACKNVEDHAILRARRSETVPALPGQPPTAWPHATLFYVWLTGIVTGAAGLAFAFIYLKKLPFL